MWIYLNLGRVDHVEKYLEISRLMTLGKSFAPCTCCKEVVSPTSLLPITCTCTHIHSSWALPLPGPVTLVTPATLHKPRVCIQPPKCPCQRFSILSDPGQVYSSVKFWQVSQWVSHCITVVFIWPGKVITTDVVGCPNPLFSSTNFTNRTHTVKFWSSFSLGWDSIHGKIILICDFI